MRMAGQNQIELLPAQSLDPGRVVYEENVPGGGVDREGRLAGAEAGGAANAELPVRGHQLLFEQPRAALFRRSTWQSVEGRLAPVIVVPGDAIHGRLNAGEEFQGFGQVLGFFDQVAGETDGSPGTARLSSSRPSANTRGRLCDARR